jgi:uncharacterized protein YrrD
MKRSLKKLEGFTLRETDGEIGKVEDFYFDDQSWTIRYLIVRTGGWLSERKVLISPSVLQQADWDNKEFPVKLTKKQIENSPDIDTEKPVSRQQEEQLASYYPWEGYWGTDVDEHGAGILGMMPSELYQSGNVQVQNPQNNVSDEHSDPHLRSADELKGYAIHTTDGQIGKVDDFIIDDRNWKINFLVVDTGTWLDRDKVLLSTKWITGVKWDNSVVIVNISTDAVQNSPDYDESQLNDNVYEKNLYNHYGKDWTAES